MERLNVLTDFAAQIPELEGPVVTSGNNARVVQQELGRQYFAAVARECVLGEKTQPGEHGRQPPQAAQSCSGCSAGRMSSSNHPESLSTGAAEAR